MNVSVLVCTYGSDEWTQPAERAAESANGQGQVETIELHLPNGTLASCRNAAAASAGGDWLCFLDADDELEPGYLAAMRARLDTSQLDGWPAGFLAETGLSLLVPAVRYIRPGGYTDSVPAIPAWGKPIHEVNCAVIGTLVPRDLFLEVGGFPEEPVYEDWALWLACVRLGAQLVPVPDAVYRAYVRPGSRNTPSDVAHGVYWRRRREHEAWLAIQGTERA